MRRITVDEVKAAYEKTGLHPKQGEFREYETCDKVCGGCAITALLAADGIDIVEEPNLRAIAESRYGGHYIGGFVCGFDGKPAAWFRDTNERERQGYADGTAAALAIFGEPSHA